MNMILKLSATISSVSNGHGPYLYIYCLIYNNILLLVQIFSWFIFIEYSGPQHLRPVERAMQKNQLLKEKRPEKVSTTV
jgi:hypothetical protein